MVYDVLLIIIGLALIVVGQHRRDPKSSRLTDEPPREDRATTTVRTLNEDELDTLAMKANLLDVTIEQRAKHLSDPPDPARTRS